MSKEISVILPVHKLEDNEKTYLATAISSIVTSTVKPKEVIVVVPKNLEKDAKSATKEIKDITKVVVNEGSTDYCTQVNVGVEAATSEFVSFLELDDQYTSKWFSLVDRYITAYPEIKMFLPIVIDLNDKGEQISTTNEPVWAMGFSDEVGYLNNSALLDYPNFNICGAVIEKETYQDFGGLKSNIKFSFIYEFLLRMTYNDVPVFVIPKYGHKHTNMREGSLFHEYRNSEINKLDPDEAAFWMESAKREFYFIEDREITYVEETV